MVNSIGAGAAAEAVTVSPTNFLKHSPSPAKSFLQLYSTPTRLSFPTLRLRPRLRLCRRLRLALASIGGPCYVVGDDVASEKINNIAPDATFLNLPAEGTSCTFRVVIAGSNFGGGAAGAASLRAAGVEAVVAESYDVEFRRMKKAAGCLQLTVTEEAWLYRKLETGGEVTVDLDSGKLIDHRSGAEYKLKRIC